MKKLFSILFMATMFGLVFTACGDDDDPPVPTQHLESLYQDPTEAHYLFDIDLNKDSSSIYLYNIVFRIGEATSPSMNIRIDAPVTVDKSGKVYTYSGTGIMPYMLRGNTPVPMPGDIYVVTNLTCIVDTKDKKYSLTFDCHGGHFDETGQLK